MPAAIPEAAPKPEPKPAPKPKGGRKWLLISVASVAGLGMIGGGYGWWQHSRAQAGTETAKKTVARVRPQARYYALEPSFVVNLTDEGAVRYLQADLQLMTRDADTLAALDTHAPAIRNRLLLLFGQQSAAQLGQRSGKERLQTAALGEVRQVLKSEGAPDKVEAAMFTSLVTQ